MQNNNSTINYGIKRNNETTYFIQLSNNEKREFFFRILWGDIKPSFYYDGVENVGSEVNYKSMLDNHFPGIFNIHMSPFIMNFIGDESKVELNKDNEVVKVNDLGLLIAYTDKVIPNVSAQVEFEKTFLESSPE